MQAVYRAAVQQAAEGGAAVMAKLVAAARQSLQAREAATRDLRERDAFAESDNQLRQCEPQLCKAYPQALARAFANPVGNKKAASPSVAEVQFDQLELMDESAVMTSVALARVQQVVMLAVEANLADLNTLISSALGFGTVQADANVLRPESYVNALKEVVEATAVESAMQLQWFSAMSGTLGRELSTLYAALSLKLRKDGVVSATYAMPVRAGSSYGGGSGSGSAGLSRARIFQSRRAATADSPGTAASAVPVPRAAPHRPAKPVGSGRSRDDSHLTLDKLRKLLSGELARPVVAPSSGNRVDDFAAQFAQQFEDSALSPEGPQSEFERTVPAALEALTEMKQVDRVMRNLEQRRVAGATAETLDADTVEGQRLALRGTARDVAQALSLEVVTLMVENMAHDDRLLEPVREVIQNLEPALLRLALVDPRFFTDRQHPARRLLQEVTHHSMAYESPSSPGFHAFHQGLQAALTPLFKAGIENADVFEATLDALQKDWSQAVRDKEYDRDAAVEVLRHAEARNLLAAKVAQGMEALPEADKAPEVVMDFLCGPWSQVVAQVRIRQGAGSADAEKFEALVPSLLWSAHPELARANPAKLTRLVPKLLQTLREGLETISYPAKRTSQFLDALMAIHQMALRPAAVQAAQPAAPDAPAERLRAYEEDDPWIGPAEAAASNFVELQDSLQTLEFAQEPIAPDFQIVVEEVRPADTEIPLGSWLELWTNDQWVRTQLTWASPHGTLFLFTGVFGNTQSMSRRLRDKLWSTGKLRLVSGQRIVDGALDAVAQTAMRNSVDSVF